jgi:hypothetical protein
MQVGSIRTGAEPVTERRAWLPRSWVVALRRRRSRAAGSHGSELDLSRAARMQSRLDAVRDQQYRMTGGRRV